MAIERTGMLPRCFNGQKVAADASGARAQRVSQRLPSLQPTPRFQNRTESVALAPWSAVSLPIRPV
jgi:hypothetical protein